MTRRSKTKERIFKASKIIYVLFATSFGLALLNEWSWMGELLISFRPQYLMASFLWVILFIFLKRHFWALGSGLLCGFILMLTLKTGDISDLGVTFASDHPLYGQGEKIRLLQLNAWYQNEEIDSLVDWLEKNHQKVDIIFMQEVEPDLKVKLDRLKPLFPYAINKKKDPWFGRAFLSKIPIEDHQVTFFKHLPIHHYDSRAHYLKVDLKTKAGRELTLFGIHAPSPISSRDWEKRNKVLLEIGQIIHEMPRKNKVLLGDFNITPYAFHYKDLLEKSGLQQGLSQLDSFPSYLPSFLRVPLDHFLVSPDIFMIDRKSIGSLGSDHLPMITTIQIF